MYKVQPDDTPRLSGRHLGPRPTGRRGQAPVGRARAGVGGPHPEGGADAAGAFAHALDAEAVERHAVGSGEDARIDDAGAADPAGARRTEEGDDVSDFLGRPEPAERQLARDEVGNRGRVALLRPRLLGGPGPVASGAHLLDQAGRGENPGGGDAPGAR